MCEVINNAILCSCAITGAVVAVLGLSTWRAQLRGQAEYELARRVLVAVLKYREAIRSARSPFSTVDIDAVDPHRQMPEVEQQQRARRRNYEERWNRVTAARAVLAAELFEVEAVWGGQVLEPFRALWDVERELYYAFLQQLDLDDPSSGEKASAEERKLIRHTIFRGAKDDPIEPRLEKAIEAIKTKFTPHLRPSRLPSLTVRR